MTEPTDPLDTWNAIVRRQAIGHAEFMRAIKQGNLRLEWSKRAPSRRQRLKRAIVGWFR